MIPVYVVAVALGVGVATTSFGSSHSPRAACAPGNGNPNYCEGGTTTTTSTTFTQPSSNPPPPSNQPQNPPPLTAPTAQTGSDGSTTVAGTLNGQTLTLTAAPPADPSKPTELKINIAGEGTVIVQAGSTVVQVTVQKDGTTTITPPGGGDPIVIKGADGKTAGQIVITVTGGVVSYELTDPGQKTIQVGKAAMTVPGAATITKESGKTTYEVKGTGNCRASLDSTVANDFTADKGVQCYVDTPSLGASTRSVRAATQRGSRHDVITTGDKADLISGGLGADTLNGRGGNDVIYGDRSLASLHAKIRVVMAVAAAADSVGGPDKIIGGVGNDKLYGDGGNDTVDGGAGKDLIYGNNGDDVLRGSAGNDDLTGGFGRDRISGGPGDDVMHVRGRGLDTVTCGAGNDTVYAGPQDKVSSDCEKVVR
jgi:Ca2+-binding RTX toxin-like protein